MLSSEVLSAKDTSFVNRYVRNEGEAGGLGISTGSAMSNNTCSFLQSGGAEAWGATISLH